MQVQNVECHLAQAQLKRFLAGEELPEDLLVDLEHHVSNCPDCRHAAERSGGVPTPSETSGKEKPRLPWATVMQVLKKKDSAAAGSPQSPPDILAAPGSELAPVPKNRVKVALLTTALAAVLVAMTLISRDPTVIFGRKASESPILAEQAKDAEPAQADVNVLDAVREGGEENPLDGVQPASLGNAGGPVADVAMMAAQRSMEEEAALPPAEEPVAQVRRDPAPAPRVAQTAPPPAPRAEEAPAKAPAPQPTPRAGVRRIEVPEGVVIPEEPTLGDRVVVAEPRPRPAQPREGTRPPTRRNERSGVGTTRVFDETGRPIRP